MVSTTNIIAAIELGSSKIAGIVGKKNSDGSIQVLACTKEDSSSFIKKGAIFNLDKTEQALKSIVGKLGEKIDGGIAKVYVGISGQSLHAVKHSVTRDLKDETIISQELIDSIRDENNSVSLDDLEILDVAPQEYKVGNSYQVDPVGVQSNAIEGRFLNIIARDTIKKNLEYCFDAAKITIADMYISPLITAQAVLTESEMRSGCALIDFGADTTTISVYKGNLLRFLIVLPIGGNSITRDIASLHIEEDEAEDMKLKYGNAYYLEGQEEADAIQTEENGGAIDFFTLNEIVEARAEEIVLNALNQIELSEYGDRLLSGIVITGGGANLRNIDELIRRKGKINKIRIAKTPRFDVADHEELKDGTFNTLLGLIEVGKENCYTPKVLEPQDPPKDLFEGDKDLREQEEAARKEKERRDEEERKRKEEEKKKKQEEKANKPNKFKSMIEKFSKEIFDDDKM